MKKIVFLLLVYVNSLSSALVIDSPGDFVLGGNLSGDTTGIEITVDDVVLDLGGNIVSATTDGIMISAAVNNIIIKNGQIKDVTGSGILFGQNCFNITVQDVSIESCATSALEIVGASGNLIERCRFSNIAITNCCTGGGATECINISFADDLKFNNVFITDNGVTSNALSMIQIEDSQRCIFQNVLISNNTASTLIGIVCEADTVSCVFRSCLVLDNLATTGFSGMYFNTVTSIDHIIIECEVANNQINAGANSPLYGYRVVQSQRIQLDHCNAFNNSNAGTAATSHAFGFYFDRVERCSTIACKSFYNSAPNNGTSNMAAGFFIGTTAGSGTGVKDSAFIRNEAVGNAGFTNERSFGFLAISGNNGNEGNAYLRNMAYLNGFSKPIAETQIVADKSSGSNPGGVPFNTIKTQSIEKLNGIRDIVSNLRIGG